MLLYKVAKVVKVVFVKFLLRNFRILASIEMGRLAKHRMLQKADIQFLGRDKARHAVPGAFRPWFLTIFRAMRIEGVVSYLGVDVEAN